MKYTLYTTKICPECPQIKKLLTENGILFRECQDIEKMKKIGIRMVPQLEADGKLLNAAEIRQSIEYLKNKNGDARKLMSESKFYESYSRFIDEKNRYETWNESVERVMKMHREKYEEKINPELKELLKEVEEAYKDKLFLGAQRALQYGGDQILQHNSRLYNCSASFCDRPDFFGGFFYLLLSGAGVGFSVQKHHIEKLPKIQKRKKGVKIYSVPDSIEGWATTIDILLSSYFVGGGKHPEYEGEKVYFDLTKIRPKGAYINGGFKAPGPEPLRRGLDLVEQLIEKELEAGAEKLRPIVAYDIAMYIADAVISGGVRRSATICMFSKDDDEMIRAKTGNWFIEHPQRGRSNNSVMLLRNETTIEEFNRIIEFVKDAGDPGFLWTDDLDFAYNPCVEVGMRPITNDGRSGFQLCNLTEINGAKSVSKEIFYKQCKVASILGTIQAGYTDFKFLTDATEEIVENEALIGVGITGMMNNPKILFDEEILKEGAEIVKKWNRKVAKIIGINQAARTTVIKPSGNSSVLLECASGIHGEHSKKYIRHIQLSEDSEMAKLFMIKNPEMCEPSIWNKGRDIVVAFPITPNENSLYKKDLMGVNQLEYVKKIQQIWIEKGTNIEISVDPRLRHNVSNTITVDDWNEVGNYIYNNRNYLCGVALLAAQGDKAYPQAPFTEIFTHNEIIEKYGEKSLFASALIEVALTAFDKNLWNACNTALGFGEKLTDKHEHLLKRDFVRRFNKFADKFKSKEECSNCLKDIYNLHKWWKIENSIQFIDWKEELKEKKFTRVDTMAAQACSGGQCDI